MSMSRLEAGGRASVSVFGWQGESPFQACPLRPVTDCNCVAARRGGEQQEVKKSSVGTRTRFGRADWRACDRKAKPGPAKSGRAPGAEGLGMKATKGSGEVVGDGRL